MKKTTNSATCQYTGAAKQSKNGIVPYEDDEQLKEKFGIIDKLAEMLRGKEVPEKHRYGWLKFWLMVVLLVLVGGGGCYWYYYHSPATEQRHAAQERAKAAIQAEKARLQAAQNKALEADLAMGLTKRESRLKQKKLAKAQEEIVIKYNALLIARASCAEVLAANGFSTEDAGIDEYERCKDNLLAQRRDYHAAALLNAVDSKVYQQQLDRFDKDISLLDAVVVSYEQWQKAEQEFAKLQNITVQDWKQMRKASADDVINLISTCTCFMLMGALILSLVYLFYAVFAIYLN